MNTLGTSQNQKSKPCKCIADYIKALSRVKAKVQIGDTPIMPVLECCYCKKNCVTNNSPIISAPYDQIIQDLILEIKQIDDQNNQPITAPKPRDYSRCISKMDDIAFEMSQNSQFVSENSWNFFSDFFSDYFTEYYLKLVVSYFEDNISWDIQYNTQSNILNSLIVILNHPKSGNPESNIKQSFMDCTQLSEQESKNFHQIVNQKFLTIFIPSISGFCTRLSEIFQSNIQKAIDYMFDRVDILEFQTLTPSQQLNQQKAYIKQFCFEILFDSVMDEFMLQEFVFKYGSKPGYESGGFYDFDSALSVFNSSKILDFTRVVQIFELYDVVISTQKVMDMLSHLECFDQPLQTPDVEKLIADMLQNSIENDPENPQSSNVPPDYVQDGKTIPEQSGDYNVLSLGYWLMWSGWFNLVNLIPLYWAVGLITPVGRIPLPIIYIPLAVVNASPLIYVIFLSINGLVIAPVILEIDATNTIKSTWKTLIKGGNKVIKSDGGSKIVPVPGGIIPVTLNGFITKQDVLPELSKLSPMMSDDYPIKQRMSLINPVYLLFLNQAAQAAKPMMGL